MRNASRFIVIAIGRKQTVHYNFDEVIDRRGTYSEKWDNGEGLIKKGIAERFDDQTIPLFTADMDFASPQPVLDALHRVVEHRMFGYSNCTCVPEYYESIIGWFGRRYGWNIRKDEILYMNGTVEALHTCIEAFTEKGDGVIIQRPVYGPFTNVILDSGRTLVNNQLIDRDGYYEMDYEDLENVCSKPENKLFFLCNPQNPTGRVFGREEIARLSDICRRHQVILVADEIHGDITRKGVTFVPAALAADPDNLVACTAINKTFNLAGLQCSNIIIPNPKLRERFRRAAGYRAPTPFAVAALIAAYGQSEDWVKQLNEYIDGNIDWTLGFLKKQMPAVRCFRPEGTYILWMDFRKSGFSPEEVRERIYSRANVVLESGTIFDPDQGAGFERVCLGTRRAFIQEAFERIAEAFA